MPLNWRMRCARCTSSRNYAQTLRDADASVCSASSRRNRSHAAQSPSINRLSAAQVGPRRVRWERRLPTHTLRANDSVDLQIHTHYSDGHWQPTELFSYLQAEGFCAVSITDHDTL